jgi:hypothetical protein
MPSKRVTFRGIVTWEDDAPTPPGGGEHPTHPIYIPVEPTHPIVIPPTTTPSPPGEVVGLHDFHYLGKMFVPEDVPNEVRFGWSRGALTGRIDPVTKKIHLMMCGATMETGWPDPVYEFTYEGVGQRGVLVANHGDITQGKRVSAAGNPKPIHGLLWDERLQGWVWTYMDSYNVGGVWDPCLGFSALGPNGVVASGPWRTGERSHQMGGYLVALPDGQFAAGAPIGSGNANAPFGAFLAAFALPPASTPPDTTNDTHVTIPATRLIYSDIDHRQPREPDADDCGWTHYGESDSKGAQPQFNPVQDGRGCTVNGELCGATCGRLTQFSAVDVISAAAYVETPTKRGVVLIGQMARTMAAHLAEYGARARCETWYGPAQEYGVKKLSPFGQNDTRYGATATGPGVTTMQSSLFVYSLEDLAAAARGEKDPILLPPVVDAANLGAVAHDGTPFPALASAMGCYGGAYWNKEHGLLFLSDIHGEWLGEWRPTIHCFAVAA